MEQDHETREEHRSPARATVIHDIEIPDEVLRQLKNNLNYDPRALTRGQLEQAIAEYRKDGRIFEDDEGVDFEDKVHLTAEEQDKSQGEEPNSFNRRKRSNQGYFCQKIEREREEKKDHAHDPHHPTAV